MPATLKRTPAQRLRKLKADARVQGFKAWCTRNGLPVPVEEYAFHRPRRWRFDYCWPDHKIALEEQGGLWTHGRHTRGAALLDEHEKLNLAAVDGWRVLYATPQTIQAPGMLLALRALLT